MPVTIDSTLYLFNLVKELRPQWVLPGAESRPAVGFDALAAFGLPPLNQTFIDLYECVNDEDRRAFLAEEDTDLSDVYGQLLKLLPLSDRELHSNLKGKIENNNDSFSVLLQSIASTLEKNAEKFPSLQEMLVAKMLAEGLLPPENPAIEPMIKEVIHERHKKLISSVAQGLETANPSTLKVWLENNRDCFFNTWEEGNFYKCQILFSAFIAAQVDFFDVNYWNQARAGELYIPSIEHLVQKISEAPFSFDKDLLKILLAAGLNVESDICMDLMHCLAQENKNCTEIIRVLVTAGAKVTEETLDYYGFTLLHYAARKDDDGEMVSMLIEAGANVNDNITATDEDLNDDDEVGRPLHWAVISGNVTTMRILINNGALVNAINPRGRNAFHIALSRDADDVDNDDIAQEIIELLLDNRGNSSHVDRDGHTPLYYAVQKGFYETAELLFNYKRRQPHIMLKDFTEHRDNWINNDLDEYHSDDASDSDDTSQESGPHTLLHFAAIKNHFDLAQRAIAALNNHKLKEFEIFSTVLHQAVRAGSIEIVKLLLDHDADITATQKDGSTALHLAVKLGHAPIVALLKMRGAPLDKKDAANKTPRDYACASTYPHKNILVLLDHPPEQKNSSSTTATVLQSDSTKRKEPMTTPNLMKELPKRQRK
ncbi:MAG TPA: ankyrin repeat domain-containing protein [Gammaproteobacteria bacterium]|nr:ankyrin repeat domain-containing protein [Gammaproteobacteria bacterium]